MQDTLFPKGFSETWKDIQGHCTDLHRPRLVTWMQKTLTLNLDDAVREAALWEVDKPREEWLFGYPAELALLAGQVRNTQEGRKSSRMENDINYQTTYLVTLSPYDCRRGLGTRFQ